MNLVPAPSHLSRALASALVLLAGGSASASTGVSMTESEALAGAWTFVIAAPIPTLGEWAMIALLVLMGVVALWQLRRRPNLIGAALGLLALCSAGVLVAGIASSPLGVAGHEPSVTIKGQTMRSPLSPPAGTASVQIVAELEAEPGNLITGATLHYQKAGDASWQTTPGATWGQPDCSNCWAADLPLAGYVEQDEVRYFLSVAFDAGDDAFLFDGDTPVGACLGVDCGAKGSCVDGDCHCAPGWAGASCGECAEDFTPSGDGTDCVVARVDSLLGVRDYGYLFWPGNHWVTWGAYQDVRHVQTGYYGLALDVSTAELSHLGMIEEESSPEEALLQGNTAVTGLATAAVSYAVTDDGAARAATGFYDTDGATANPSRLIDMGRFMQRVEVPKVTYTGSSELTGSVQLAAMTRHVVLSHRVTRVNGAGPLTISIDLSGDAVEQYPDMVYLEGARAVSVRDGAGDGWSFIIPEREGASSTISRAQDGALSFQSSFVAPAAGEELVLSVIAVPSNAATEEQLSVWLRPRSTVTVHYAQLNRDGSGGEGLTEAAWDPERGVYGIELGNMTEVGAPAYPDWSDPSLHNWYNRHRVVITNDNSGPVSVPLAFNGGGNAAFYITGGSPLLRDRNGEPVGAPVQISKNWHEPGNAWYHLYSALELSQGSHEFELTFAHSKWGDAYAAAHAQLSLIGWGRNQQWDESSLGAWGESITYDPDLTLGRSMVDDVRPFLVDAKGEWGWTGNVGGANFLVYDNPEIAQASGRPGHQLGRLRTHYAYTGPNLTKVIYAGLTRDGKIEAKISTQLGRTDDLVRAYYHLSYTFLEEVSYDRLALFQVAADRYCDNGFTRYAYGNAAGVTFDAEVPDHGTTGYASESARGIALSGEAPWVMLYASDLTSGNLPEHLANLAFVVRSYDAKIGGVHTTTPQLNIVRTYQSGYSQMAFELGIPYDPSSRIVPAGSVVTATVEYLVPPADKSAYYGESDYLTAMSPQAYQSTDMILTLAEENQLEVSASVGSVTRSQPVELQAASGATAVQFTLSGGLGYTPLTIHGLARPDGWRLEQEVDGTWERVSQEVEGNDYWQAYDDAGASSFDLIFNLHNRGTHEYRLVR